MRVLIVLAIGFAVPAAAFSQEHSAGIFLNQPDKLEWKAGPPSATWSP